MSKGDSFRSFYECARDEVVQRIKLRDAALLINLSAVGTLIGLSVIMKTEAILLTIPYISYGVCLIVSQHNRVIGTIALYNAFEVEEYINDINEYAPQWDRSKAVCRYHEGTMFSRTIGHFVLTIGPSFAGLLVNIDCYKLPFPDGIIWWFGACFVGLSIYEIFAAHRYRKDILEKIKSSVKEL